LNKTVAVCVVLFAVLALSFATNRSAVPSGTLAGPRVIARVNLTNQTATIPTTTIFTPQQTGLYRASAYMNMTTPVSGGLWAVLLNWNDDVGAESTFLAQLDTGASPPQDYGSSGTGVPDCTVIFRGLAGTPVTYQVYGTPAGTYSLFIVVERLD
jgi:hypothetical protein